MQKEWQAGKDDWSHGFAAVCIDRFISVKMARRHPVNSLLNYKQFIIFSWFKVEKISCRILYKVMEEVKSEEMYMEDLDGWILEENKVKRLLTSWMQMLKHPCSGGHLQISFSSTWCARQHGQADVVDLQRIKAGSLQGGCLLCLWTSEQQQDHSLRFCLQPFSSGQREWGEGSRNKGYLGEGGEAAGDPLLPGKGLLPACLQVILPLWINFLSGGPGLSVSSWVRLSMPPPYMLLTWRCSKKIPWSVVR